MGKRDVLEQYEFDVKEKDVYKTIGSNILKRMDSRFNSKHRKITQDELAADIAKQTAASCSRSTVARWISGSRRPSILHLISMCQIFDCSVESLCGIKEKNRDNEAAERFTGLSHESVQYLHHLQPQERAVLDSILNKESGLDTILQNVTAAKIAAAERAKIADICQMKIEGPYLTAVAKSYETESSAGWNQQIPEPDYYYNIAINLEREIKDYSRDIQIQEFRLENNKRQIRQVIEQFLDRLIPPEKNKEVIQLDKAIHAFDTAGRKRTAEGYKKNRQHQ